MLSINIFTYLNPEIVEDSDQEDPELALRNILAKSNEALTEKKASFVEAAATILDNRGIAIDLERSRMQTEDFNAQLIRKVQGGDPVKSANEER